MEHSEGMAKIAKALAAFQAEVKDPARDGENPHFKSKYVTIDKLLDAVRPMAAKHGISIVQSTGGNGQDIGVTTMILHESGEWLMTDALTIRPVQNNPQGCMSAITYARRYSLSAALGVAWDDDDDGNAASAPAPKAETKSAQPKQDKNYWMRKVQEIAKARSLNADDLKAVLKMQFKKSSSKDLTEDETKNLAEHLEDYMIELIDAEALKGA